MSNFSKLQKYITKSQNCEDDSQNQIYKNKIGHYALEIMNEGGGLFYSCINHHQEFSYACEKINGILQHALDLHDYDYDIDIDQYGSGIVDFFSIRSLENILTLGLYDIFRKNFDICMKHYNNCRGNMGMTHEHVSREYIISNWPSQLRSIYEMLKSSKSTKNPKHDLHIQFKTQINEIIHKYDKQWNIFPNE